MAGGEFVEYAMPIIQTRNNGPFYEWRQTGRTHTLYRVADGRQTWLADVARKHGSKDFVWGGRGGLFSAAFPTVEAAKADAERYYREDA